MGSFCRRSRRQDRTDRPGALRRVRRAAGRGRFASGGTVVFAAVPAAPTRTPSARRSASRWPDAPWGGVRPSSRPAAASSSNGQAGPSAARSAEGSDPLAAVPVPRPGQGASVGKGAACPARPSGSDGRPARMAAPSCACRSPRRRSSRRRMPSRSAFRDGGRGRTRPGAADAAPGWGLRYAAGHGRWRAHLSAASGLTRVATPRHGAHASMTGAVKGPARCAATERVAPGIRVNTVAPGSSPRMSAVARCGATRRSRASPDRPPLGEWAGQAASAARGSRSRGADDLRLRKPWLIPP